MVVLNLDKPEIKVEEPHQIGEVVEKRRRTCTE